MDAPARELGVAGFAAMTVMFAAAVLAAGVIWLLTTDVSRSGYARLKELL